MKTFFKTLVFFLLTSIIISCSGPDEKPLSIALSKGTPPDSYQNYYDWIANGDSLFQCFFD